MKEVERPIIGRVSKIVINHDVKVTVHVTEGRQYATVKAGENIISEVTTTMVDSTLTIRNESGKAWSTSFKNRKEVSLYLNNTVTAISYFGIQDVTVMDTIRANQFTYYCDESGGRVSIPLIANRCNIEQHSGVSDLIIVGRCNDVDVYYKGTGWIYLQDFKNSNMVVTNNGTGDILVNASNNLTATIKSIGNIVYMGFPSITLVKDGKGNLRPAN
ncbi:GIN domain-containing protein [Williamwhitmania taraxaci]|nr:DUF2807 domain-containing protein [Williamwhitmania taraxaci]